MASYFDTGRSNPYISATQGFLDSYMRGMQLMQQERRYQENRMYRDSMLKINQQRADAYDRAVAQGGNRTRISIFSPSEIKEEGTVEEIIKREISAMSPSGTEKSWLPKFLETKTIPASEVAEAKERVYQRLQPSDMEKQQIDIAFDTMMDETYPGGINRSGINKRIVKDKAIETYDINTKQMFISGQPSQKSKELFPSDTTSKYKTGTTINKGGKQYIIVGFDEDGEPLVELAE